MNGTGFTTGRWVRSPVHRGIKYRLRVLIGFVIWFLVGSLSAYGPLGLGFGLFTFLAGLIVGVTMAVLLSRALTSQTGQEKWRLRFLWPARVILLALAVVIALQLYSTGTLPQLTKERLRGFDRLSAALSAHYPYLEEKGISLAKMQDTYRDKVRAAPTDEAFLEILAEMLSLFDDGHTYLLPSDPVGYEDTIEIGRVERIDDEFIVSRTYHELLASDLLPGTAIFERDGLPVEDYFSELAPWLATGSSRQSRERRVLDQLLTVEAESTAQFTVRTPDGEMRTIEVSGHEAAGLTADQAPAAVRHELVSPEIGYIEVTSFAFDLGLPKALDKAIADMSGTRSLIIDLRQNQGGLFWNAHRFAGHFLAEPFAYAQVVFRHRLPHFAWQRKQTLRVVPREGAYAGAVVILTGSETRHAAEAFVVAMKDSGRALVVGEATAGEVGVPIRFRLPGGQASVTVGAFQRLGGPGIEGAGLEPDVVVRPSLEHIVRNEDAVLQWAIDYLR